MFTFLIGLHLGLFIGWITYQISVSGSDGLMFKTVGGPYALAVIATSSALIAFSLVGAP